MRLETKPIKANLRIGRRELSLMSSLRGRVLSASTGWGSLSRCESGGRSVNLRLFGAVAVTMSRSVYATGKEGLDAMGAVGENFSGNR